MGPVFVWSCVEPYVGIMCACLPTFAPLVRIFWNKVRGKSANHRSDYDVKNAQSNNTGNNLNRSQKGSHWNKLGDSSSRLRNEDEVELTNDITGPQKADSRLPQSKHSDDTVHRYAIGGITVKNEVEWTSSAVCSE